MKFVTTSAAALMLTTIAAQAGGIERAPQSLAPLFEAGANFVELSFGRVSPDVTGRDVLGNSIGNVGKDYGFAGLAYKRQINDSLSAALIIEQPFGADISYAGDPASTMLGGTAVEVNSTTFTALLRYKMENNFGVHGGIRGSRADADLTLQGLGYGGPGYLSGYNMTTNGSTGWGWVAGASWEKPEIAARVSLTYNSPISHDFKTTETVPARIAGAMGLPGTTIPGEMEVKTPRSWNLEFQTGVAPDTLVFGSVRWVKWSEFKVAPSVFKNVPIIDPATGAPTGATQGSLVDLEDSTTYTIGVGRKFTENWSGSASFNWEKKGSNLVSPLAPTNGRKGITLAAIYTMDNMKITAGVNYTKLGNASPETGDVARAEMKGNSALGIGVKVGFTF